MGSPSVPESQVLSRLPVSLLYGLVVGSAFYFISKRKNAKINVTLVCPDCENVKRDDGILKCSCGGQYEDIKKMQWVDSDNYKQI